MKLCATQALRRIGGVVNGCAYGTARKNAILAAHKHIFYYFCKTLKKSYYVKTQTICFSYNNNNLCCLPFTNSLACQ